MSGAEITPVLLTLDEEANLDRTLNSLTWARHVLVLDSGSRDRTEAIAKSHPNVTWACRRFDGWASQWGYALAHEAVSTPYVLALDADMAPEPGLIDEIDARIVGPQRAGGIVRFRYRVGGRPLFGSLYPPDLRVFDRRRVRLANVGHHHAFIVDPPVVRLRRRLIHDDRKSLDRFLASQLGYAAREQARIEAGDRIRFRDRLRRRGLTPPLIGALAWLRAGAFLRGRAATRYALERSYYETLLSLRLLCAEPGDGEASVREERS